MAVTTYANYSGSSLISSYLDVYKRRMRRERRLRYLALAVAGVCAVWTLFVLLDPAPTALLPAFLALTVALPVASLVFEAAHRPSDADAARLLDSLLDNQQRLVTSVELLSLQGSGVRGQGSVSRLHDLRLPILQAQLGSTESMLAKIDPKILYPMRFPWLAMLLSLGLLLLALSVVLLKSGSSFNAFQAGQLPPDQSAVAAVQSPTPASGLPGSELTPTDTPTALESTPVDGQNDTNPVDASQAADSQQAQADLDRLGKALDGQSATQGAADSLRQGKYGDAAKQLAELGTQNDQLSDAAKQGLADSLEQAANDTQTDSALKQAEQKAADALRKGDYNQIAEALKELGSAVQEAGSKVLPQQQLAQGFPENSDQSSSPGSQSGQSGQQSQSQQPQQGQNGQQGQSDSSSQSGQQGTDSAGGQQGQPGNQSQQDNSGGGGDQSSQDGQGIAPGEGHRVSGPVDPSRPDAKSNPFELDGQGNPNNTKPVDKTNNPALTLEGTASSGVPSSPGSGNTLDTPGESNNLPVDRWNVIERYFGHGYEK